MDSNSVRGKLILFCSFFPDLKGARKVSNNGLKVLGFLITIHSIFPSTPGFENKNLFIIELKSDSISITQDDIDAVNEEERQVQEKIFVQQYKIGIQQYAARNPINANFIPKEFKCNDGEIRLFYPYDDSGNCYDYNIRGYYVCMILLLWLNCPKEYLQYGRL